MLRCRIARHRGGGVAAPASQVFPAITFAVQRKTRDIVSLQVSMKTFTFRREAVGGTPTAVSQEPM